MKMGSSDLVICIQLSLCPLAIVIVAHWLENCLPGVVVERLPEVWEDEGSIPGRVIPKTL